MADPIAQYDLTLVRGDTFERQTFVMQDSSGAHIDFTGYTALAQVRAAANAPGVILEFTTGVNADGDAFIEATAEQTSATGALPSGVWDLQLTSPSGRNRTYLAGDVTIIQDVSR